MPDLLEFDPRTHRYFRNGVELPSVTTILKHAGVVAGFGSDAQLQRGRDVHTFCEQFDRGELDLRKVPKDQRPYVHAWKSFRSISQFEPTHIEEQVWADGYAGKCDRFGLRGDRSLRVVLDLKTMSSGSPPSYARYQTAAYAHAFSPGELFERIVVGLRPNGTFSLTVWDAETFRRDLAIFLGFVRDFSLTTVSG